MLRPQLAKVENELATLAHAHASIPLLARTHGQAATPTTVGKEIATFVLRLRRAVSRIERARTDYNRHGC